MDKKVFLLSIFVILIGAFFAGTVATSPFTPLNIAVTGPPTKPLLPHHSNTPSELELMFIDQMRTNRPAFIAKLEEYAASLNLDEKYPPPEPSTTPYTLFDNNFGDDSNDELIQELEAMKELYYAVNLSNQDDSYPIDDSTSTNTTAAHNLRPKRKNSMRGTQMVSQNTPTPPVYTFNYINPAEDSPSGNHIAGETIREVFQIYKHDQKVTNPDIDLEDYPTISFYLGQFDYYPLSETSTYEQPTVYLQYDLSCKTNTITSYPPGPIYLPDTPSCGNFAKTKMWKLDQKHPKGSVQGTCEWDSSTQAFKVEVSILRAYSKKDHFWYRHIVMPSTQPSRNNSDDDYNLLYLSTSTSHSTTIVIQHQTNPIFNLLRFLIKPGDHTTSFVISVYPVRSTVTTVNFDYKEAYYQQMQKVKDNNPDLSDFELITHPSLLKYSFFSILPIFNPQLQYIDVYGNNYHTFNLAGVTLDGSYVAPTFVPILVKSTPALATFPNSSEPWVCQPAENWHYLSAAPSSNQLECSTWTALGTFWFPTQSYPKVADVEVYHGAHVSEKCLRGLEGETDEIKCSRCTPQDLDVSDLVPFDSMPPMIAVVPYPTYMRPSSLNVIPGAPVPTVSKPSIWVARFAPLDQWFQILNFANRHESSINKSILAQHITPFADNPPHCPSEALCGNYPGNTSTNHYGKQPDGQCLAIAPFQLLGQVSFRQTIPNYNQFPTVCKYNTPLLVAPTQPIDLLYRPSNSNAPPQPGSYMYTLENFDTTATNLNTETFVLSLTLPVRESVPEWQCTYMYNSKESSHQPCTMEAAEVFYDSVATPDTCKLTVKKRICVDVQSNETINDEACRMFVKLPPSYIADDEVSIRCG